MTKTYKFDYDMYAADVEFKVDTSVFTKEHANATLEFFLWDYDDEADPIDEVMKKYAMAAIREATFHDFNTVGVIDKFNDFEGFCKVDGSSGITLIHVNGYEFDEEDLDVTITSND